MNDMLSGPPPPERSLERLQVLFDYDPEFPLDIEETLLEERDGIAIHDLRYSAAPKRRFAAYLVVPPGAASPASSTSTPRPEAGIRSSTRR